MSLIIPTYNEAVVIEDKIKNTLQLNYPSEKLEIILIDSASTDDTVKIAKGFDQIKTIRQTERQGKSAALAEVFKVVSGDIIVITDADALLDKNVLLNAMPYLSDNNVGAVTGKQILVDPNDTTSHKGEQSYRDFFDMIRLAESNMQSTMIFNGPFMAFKKEVLEAPSQNSVADDTEMAIQVIKKGYRTLYVQKAIFYENIPLSNKSRMKQKERRAQGLVQSFWRHRGILFNKKYGEFGTKIFPAEFAVHLILPFSLVVSIIISALSLYANFVNTIFIMLVYLIIVVTYAISVYSSIGKFLSDSAKPQQESRIRSIIITFYSFIQLQFALFTGALKLIIYGSEHKWEQIADVRIKINK
ncbi:glycosyltransferase [Methanococcoides sp. SA1]|nr:glycosyltransferase [Methanococcoides sp. SA1]